MKMSIYTQPTFGFYSENTMREMFDTLSIFDYNGKKTMVLMAKTKGFAVIGTAGVRPEDKKDGMYIMGTVEFKNELNLGYNKDVPELKNALQVIVVDISEKKRRQGYGLLLYFNLVQHYVIIWDNMQYLGDTVPCCF